LLRALIHFWRVHLAVILGAAVATAVLTGALVVGDSVRGSLRDLTLDRLGRIDFALVSQRFFPAELARRLAEHPAGSNRTADVAPAIVLSGTAVHAGSGARASRISVLGVDAAFTSLYGPDAALDFSRREGQLFPSVIVNQALARELGANAGDTLLLSFERSSQVPRDTLMGEKDTADVVGTLRVVVAAALPDRGLGRFALAPNQQSPLNAYVALESLQRGVGQPGRVNGLFAAEQVADADPDALLREVLEPGDLGLVVKRGADHFTVESREFVLRPNLDRAIGEVARALDLPILRLQSYLANSIRGNGRVVPYSMVLAVDPEPPAPWSALESPAGAPVEQIPEDGILLNTWAAEDLGAQVGESIDLDYFAIGPREELTETRATFRLAGVVAMRDLAGDASLTPDYPGIGEADDISDWDPPFPIELDRIRERDEDYWDRWRGTPKAFVAAESGRRLWTTRFGATTAVRIGVPEGATVDQTERRFLEALLAELPPEAFGLGFQPVKEQGLRAAAGATDFAGLFVGFSLFLIVSAALLVGLLFTLGVERRAAEIGLWLAVGYPVGAVRRQLLAEGTVLAGAGAVLGIAGGVGYAGLLMVGLRTVWLPAVGSSALYLHVRPLSLLFGGVAAMVVVLLAIALAVRRLRRVPPPILLAGSLRAPLGRRRVLLAPWIAWGGAALALVLVAYAIATGSLSSPGLAFGAGTLLLIAGLAFFAMWCRGSRRRSVAAPSAALLAMAARNSAWNPGRSILSVALVGTACFMIVAVGANREEFGAELQRQDSGAGGFALYAESDVPLHLDLDRPEDRFDLGFSDEDETAMEQAHVLPFRLLPGDDASCLNLYRPERPRILGVPPELVRRQAFRFRQTVELPDGVDNPWQLLEQPLEPDVIPVIGDANSTQWILHLGVGQELELEDEYGRPLRLRLVGTLERSVFQSELLISEEAFLRHFPGRTGYRVFLIDAPWEGARETATRLERVLDAYGFDCVTTAEKLAGFQVVEHTYLSTFQTLGGLGLLLGTIGLGVILVRNVMERRGELATLRAFGFRRASLGWLVAAENAFLLLVGMLIGTLAALAAVAPRLTVLHVPWVSLATTLGAILVVGMLSSAVAVLGALRVPLLPALKAGD